LRIAGGGWASDDRKIMNYEKRMMAADAQGERFRIYNS
jgi:hypothetical protein